MGFQRAAFLGRVWLIKGLLWLVNFGLHWLWAWNDWPVDARYFTVCSVCCQLKALQHLRVLLGSTGFTVCLCIWIVVDLKKPTFTVAPSTEPFIFITLLCPNYFPLLNVIYLYCKDFCPAVIRNIKRVEICRKNQDLSSSISSSVHALIDI